MTSGGESVESKAPLRLVCFELRGQELALPIDEVMITSMSN